MTTNTTVAIVCKHLAHCRMTIRSGSLHSVGVILTAASLVHICCVHETNNSIQPLMLCEKSGVCLKPLKHSMNYFSVGPRFQSSSKWYKLTNLRRLSLLLSTPHQTKAIKSSSAASPVNVSILIEKQYQYFLLFRT